MTNPGSQTAGAPEAHPGQSLPAAGIRDVAAAAGVSTATVSRALRGLPRVSQSTRHRILVAAANLGYVASSAASELARGRAGRKGTLDVSGLPASPSRGTVLVVNGPWTGAGIPDERRPPPPAEIEQLVQSVASAHGFAACVKSCSEADMLDTVRAAAASAVGIVLNRGGLSPASTELRHALASTHIPTVEIHINNDYYRREKIHTSPQSSACTVVISGAGVYGYKLAIDYLSAAVQPHPDTERWMATAAAPRAH